MTPGGDYSLVSGADLVKKLILRRLVTQRGGFSHLPNYGTGVIAIKEPLNSAGLARAKQEIERQVLLEPEVKEVSVSLSLDNANGILTIIVKGRLKPTGESFSASFKLPSTGVL
jgi:phage baseplate assembly protein W